MNDDSTGTVRTVDGTSRTDAAETLAAAFATDPVFGWMARDRDDLGQRLHHGFDAMLRAELRQDDPILHLSSGGECASIWHGVDRWKAPPVEAIRVVPGFVRSFGVRLDRLMRMMLALDKQHPEAPHYHLAFIGTRPEAQGSGCGSAVMAAMTERCDTEGVAAYLENSKPANEAFYVRHGFVTTGPIALPKGAPPLTAMWRDPR